MQIICSQVGAIQWVAEEVKIQSRKTVFSCAYERCRALVRIRNFSLSCHKMSLFVITDVAARLFSKSDRRIPENAEKGL